MGFIVLQSVQLSNELAPTGKTSPYMAEADQIDEAWHLTTRQLNKADLSVATYRRDTPGLGLTVPTPVGESYLVIAQLRDAGATDLFREASFAARTPLHAGGLHLFDLQAPWVADLQQPFHSLHFFLPRASLDELTYETGQPKLSDLREIFSEQSPDPEFFHLAQALMPALRRPEEASALFVGHMFAAMRLHIAQRYGGLSLRREPPRGGLAPWQEKRVKEMLGDQLRGDLTIRELSEACAMSPTHFARAFKRTIGVPPHQWLVNQRVETAKHLLRTTREPISNIALFCGFADQSHLTRAFSRLTGSTPAAWRRNVRE